MAKILLKIFLISMAISTAVTVIVTVTGLRFTPISRTIYGRQTIKALLKEKRSELEQFTMDFGKQDEVWELSTNVDLDTRCESLNSHHWCPTIWDTDSYEKPLKSALETEKMDIGEYDSIRYFLEKIKMRTVRKPNNCKDCVEIEYLLKGIRYSPNKTMTQDSEYLQVEDLGNNWYFYIRDWN